ncbi:MAG: HK97 family phage prohead protease [Chloroflexi bacterium]|nr:HK97 family phage prohead protease [Chloroflexota bacterium]
MAKLNDLTVKIELSDQNNPVESRTFKVTEFRAAEKDGKPVLEGLASVFGQYSEDLGGFVEIIEPGFFDGVMADDVRSLWNHNPDYVLGRTKSGTLELEQREDGLFQRTYPPVVEPESAQWAKDLMVSIRRGDVDQMSFGFIVKSTFRGDPEDGDEWYVLGDKVIRRLKKGGAKQLLDVSPVTYPAYPQTSVSANTRSRFESFQESLRNGQEPEAQGKADERQEPLDLLQRRLDLVSKD